MSALTHVTDSWNADLDFEIDQFDYLYGCYDLGNWLYDEILPLDPLTLPPDRSTLPPDPLQNLDADVDLSWGHTPREFWTLCPAYTAYRPGSRAGTTKWSLDVCTYTGALHLDNSTALVTGNCLMKCTFIHRRLVLEGEWWLLNVVVKMWPPDFDPG